MDTSTYIGATVGAFRLALPEASVAGVITDVLTSEPASFRGQRLAVVDLKAVFEGERRLIAPFAIAVEARGERILVGVDTVAQTLIHASPLPVPKLGLLRPDLFEGALRDTAGLTLVLSPRSLIGL